MLHRIAFGQGRAMLRWLEWTPTVKRIRRLDKGSLYQNRIKTLSETTVGVVRRAKSRFPRLLERLRKRETEWTVWNRTSRAQGGGIGRRCLCANPSHRFEFLHRKNSRRAPLLAWLQSALRFEPSVSRVVRDPIAIREAIGSGPK